MSFLSNMTLLKFDEVNNIDDYINIHRDAIRAHLEKNIIKYKKKIKLGSFCVTKQDEIGDLKLCISKDQLLLGERASVKEASKKNKDLIIKGLDCMCAFLQVPAVKFIDDFTIIDGCHRICTFYKKKTPLLLVVDWIDLTRNPQLSIDSFISYNNHISGKFRK